MGFREPLCQGEVYHVFTKSITGFEIFNDRSEYERMKKSMTYVQVDDWSMKLSRFLEDKAARNNFEEACRDKGTGKTVAVQLLSYCLMPTHIHFLLKQMQKNGISIF